jgi:hypothetical protein
LTAFKCRKSEVRDLRYILGPLVRGALELLRELPPRETQDSIPCSMGFSPPSPDFES